MKAIISFGYDAYFDAAAIEVLHKISIWPVGKELDSKISDAWGAAEKEKGLKYCKDEIIVNLEKTNGLPKFEVVKILDDSSQIDQLSAILDRLNSVSLQLAFNQKCNVGIGDGLLKISQVKVETDCCTDHLQRELNSGWRIIACCVQSQRRPDYVLGK